MIRTIFILLCIAASFSLPRCFACTSAIVSGSRTDSGRPMLWKNRDTSEAAGKVAYVPASPDGCLAYVALFNASDHNLAEAWIGMNSAGFAIMNTASYNLNADAVPKADMDREGIVMSLALKHCHTVDDFETLLEELPRPLGVEANFGVIDATGRGAFFETGNYSFVRYNLEDAPEGVLVRTNYSHSGRPGEGYGQIREANALTLLRPSIESSCITPELFTDTLSCSFYHSLLGVDMLQSGRKWIVDQDFIPRFSSSASVVIEGVLPMETPLPGCGESYVMWTALGYPPCAQVMPVWCKSGGVDPALQGSGEDGCAPLCTEALARKKEVFSAPDGNRDRYIYLPALINDRGTGILTSLRRSNHEVYARLRGR